MSSLLKILNKYIILMIISSLFGMPWFYVQNLLSDMSNDETYALVHYIPNVVNYLIRLIILILLIIDFRKMNLKYIVLTSIATLFYPLLGVVILSLLILEKEKAVNNNV